MKKLIILLIILGILVLSNPTMNDYTEWIKEKVNEQTQSQGVLVSFIAGLAATQVDKVTDRDNYWLFSVYTTHISNEPFIVFGIAKLFIPVKGTVS